MDEYAIGEVVEMSDGKLYRFKGGEPKDWANWTPEVVESTPEDAALKRTTARGGNAITDFLAMARHGLTLGFDDEIAGRLKGPEARDEIRQRVADRRLLNPGASGISEVAGGLPAALLPVGAGRAAVRGGAGLFGAIGKGAAVGAVEGGLLGMGESETETMGGRATDALPYAAGGAVAGGLLSAAPVVGNALLRRAQNRGARVAGELADATGLTPDFGAVRQQADDAVSAARAQHYGPLDAMGKVPGVTTEPRTLGELQKLSKRMERTDPLGAANMRTSMEQAFPGLKAADQAYAPTAQVREALTNGRKAWNKSAADIQRAQASLSPEALTAFREGQFHEIVRRLNAREDNAVEVLRRFMDSGPETRAQIKTLFADEAAFNSFIQVLGKERSAAVVAGTLRRVAPFAIPGLIGAGVATGVNSLFK